MMMGHWQGVCPNDRHTKNLEHLSIKQFRAQEQAVG